MANTHLGWGVSVARNGIYMHYGPSYVYHFKPTLKPQCSIPRSTRKNTTNETSPYSSGGGVTVVIQAHSCDFHLPARSRVEEDNGGPSLQHIYTFLSS